MEVCQRHTLGQSVRGRASSSATILTILQAINLVYLTACPHRKCFRDVQVLQSLQLSTQDMQCLMFHSCYMCVSLTHSICLHFKSIFLSFYALPKHRWPVHYYCSVAVSIFTQVLYLSTILRYLYFTWVFLFHATWYFYSTTSHGKYCTFYSTIFIW